MLQDVSQASVIPESRVSTQTMLDLLTGHLEHVPQYTIFKTITQYIK